MRSFYANDLKVQGFEMRSLSMITNAEKDRAKEIFKKYGNKPITSIADATIGFEVTTDGGMNHCHTTITLVKTEQQVWKTGGMEDWKYFLRSVNLQYD
jgi:hypothetical protein